MKKEYKKAAKICRVVMKKYPKTSAPYCWANRFYNSLKNDILIDMSEENKMDWVTVCLLSEGK